MREKVDFGLFLSKSSTAKFWLTIFVVCALFFALVIYSVPARQGDPLHYLGVAWAMYKNHLYLSTYSGETLDLEKSPLLYWLIVGGWRIFGVHNIWPFILTYLIGFVNLILSAWLARQFFPEKPRVAGLTVLILITSLYWLTYYTDIRFEGLLTLFGLLFLNLVFKTTVSKNIFYWIFSGIAFGFCVFSKGFVVFIYFLPLALFILSLQSVDYSRRCLKLILFLMMGLLIPLAWIVGVYYQHGAAAVQYLLFGQVANRVEVHFSFGMQFFNLIKNLLPWSLVFIFLLFIIPCRNFLERRTLFLLLSILIAVSFLSLFVKIQSPRYLIPVLPLAAILMAVFVDKKINAKICLWIGAVFLSGLSIYEMTGKHRIVKSLEPAAKQIKILEDKHYPVAQFSISPGYQNFGFLGRLQHELPMIIPVAAQEEWISKNPDGWIVKAYKTLPNCDVNYQSWQIRTDQSLILIPAKHYASCNK